MFNEKERRLKCIVDSRKKYSQFTKTIVKKGSDSEEERQRKEAMLNEKLQILRIAKELKICKEQYSNIVKCIGQAHRDAKLLQEKEEAVESMLKKIEQRVSLRANKVLIDEIKRKKRLKNEKEMLNQCEEIFTTDSNPSTSIVKYTDWDLLEAVVSNELNEAQKRVFSKLKESSDVKTIDVIMKKTKSVEVQTDEICDQYNQNPACKIQTHLPENISSKPNVNSTSTCQKYSLPSLQHNKLTDLSKKDKSTNLSYNADKQYYKLNKDNLDELIERIRLIRKIISKQKIKEKKSCKQCKIDDLPLNFQSINLKDYTEEELLSMISTPTPSPDKIMHALNLTPSPVESELQDLATHKLKNECTNDCLASNKTNASTNSSLDLNQISKMIAVDFNEFIKDVYNKANVNINENSKPSYDISWSHHESKM